MSDISEKLKILANELAKRSDKPTPHDLGVMLVDMFDFFKELSPAIGYLREAGLNDRTLYQMGRVDVIDAFINASNFADK